MYRRCMRILLWAGKARPKMARSPQQEDSLETTLLCRSGCTQEEHQLLCENGERRDRAGRPNRGQPERTGPLAEHAAGVLRRSYGGDPVQRLDLRSSESPGSAGKGGRSDHAESDLCLQKEKRPDRRAENRRPAALRSDPGMLHGAAGDARTAASAAVSQPVDATVGAHEEPHRRAADGNRNQLQRRATARTAVLPAAAGRMSVWMYTRRASATV